MSGGGTEAQLRQRLTELEAENAQLRSQTAPAVELTQRLAQIGGAAVLTAPAEHSALLEQIVQAAMDVLGAQAGSLYLIDEAAEELVWEVALGPRAAPLLGQRLPLGQGMAGWVAATGQAIAVADVQQDPRWSQQVGQAVGYLPKTMLAMPLVLADRVIGVLQLLDKNGGNPFDNADMALLGRFANQAAVAIDQSRAIRSLTAMMRTAFDGLDVEMDVVDAAARAVEQVESSPEYQDTIDIARRLGTIIRDGDAGRRLALDVTGAVAKYLETRRRGIGGLR